MSTITNEILLTLTVDDFKSLFALDFPYLPVWSSESFYNTDEEVYYDVKMTKRRKLVRSYCARAEVRKELGNGILLQSGGY